MTELIESGIDWIGTVPTHWKKEKIYRLCEKVTSGRTPNSGNEGYYLDGDINWVQSGDLTDGCVTKTQKRLTEEGLANSPAKILPKGTLLIAMYGATIGKLGILSIDAATNQACCALMLRSHITTKYMFYTLLNMRLYLINESYGGGQPNISQETVKQQYILHPPKPEQEAIARHLDKVTAQIDAAIDIKQRQVEKLEAIRDSLINETIKTGANKFVKFKEVSREPITSIPEHYKVVKLKSITRQIVDGTHFTPNYLEGDTSEGIPFIRITDLQNKEIDLSRTKYISPEEHKELSKRCLPEVGDLLLSKNGTIGLTKIVDWNYECSLFVSICLIKPVKQLIDVEYLNYYFQSDYMAYQFYHESKQITVSNLHLENIRDFLIVLPPVKEQREIAQVLRHKENQFSQLRVKLNKQIAVLRAYRRSVIHEYVTGKKRVMATGAKNEENS